MRAELVRSDAPDDVVASASWFEGRVVPESGDDALLARVFRSSAVSIDAPAMRQPGTSGPVVVEPGDLEWFRAAALLRGRAEGYEVRFTTDRPGGWDPAMDPQTYGWAGRKTALPHES
jgi:hypothetical protein